MMKSVPQQRPFSRVSRVQRTPSLRQGREIQWISHLCFERSLFDLRLYLFRSIYTENYLGWPHGSYVSAHHVVLVL